MAAAESSVLPTVIIGPQNCVTSLLLVLQLPQQPFSCYTFPTAIVQTAVVLLCNVWLWGDDLIWALFVCHRILWLSILIVTLGRNYEFLCYVLLVLVFFLCLFTFGLFSPSFPMSKLRRTSHYLDIGRCMFPVGQNVVSFLHILWSCKIKYLFDLK